MISNVLTANEWNLRTQTEQPDVERTEMLLEKERERVAKQIFHHVLDALEESGKKNMFNVTFRGGQPEITEEHTKLISFARRACYFLGISTYLEYTEMAAIVDEQGILTGMRQYPQEKEDVMEDVYGER